MFIANAGLASTVVHFLAGNLTLADCGFEVLTLPHIISLMVHNEMRRKEFYTLFLKLTWSDMPFRKEDNHFAEECERRARKSFETGAVIDYDLTHLLNDDVRDARITERCESRDALITLARARYYPHIVGRKADLILTPESAGEEYRRKLLRLGEANLDQ